MADWHEPATEAAAEVLRVAREHGGIPDGEEGRSEGVVSAWVLLIEVQTPEGPYLHRLQGPEGITVWARAGMLWDALHWPED